MVIYQQVYLLHNHAFFGCGGEDQFPADDFIDHIFGNAVGV